MSAKASLGFDVPFVEAIRWSRERVPLLPDHYYSELTGSARSRAFTVSYAASLDQVNRILSSLNQTIAEGGTMQQWQASISDDLLGLPNWHKELIFRNAVQTAFQSGHWQGQLQVKDAQPYLMYDAINDRRTRPEHRKLDSYIAPVDDPVWNRIYPPNGHACRCGTIQLSETQAKARGWSGNTQPPPGEPDKGWDYHPAKQSDKTNDLLKHKIQKTESRAIKSAAENIEPPTFKTLDDYIEAGKQIVAELPDPGDGVLAFAKALHIKLNNEVGTQQVQANTTHGGKSAQTVKAASLLFPDTWVQAANDLGKLTPVARKGRQGHITLDGEGSKYARIPGYKVVLNEKGRGFLFVKINDIGTATHELAHRIQAALPALDEFFQMEHYRRTNGDPLEHLSMLRPRHNYGINEMTRPDKYVEPYQGKEYRSGGALEVLTMSFEWLLASAVASTSGKIRDRQKKLVDLYNNDPVMFHLTLGLLFRFKP